MGQGGEYVVHIPDVHLWYPTMNDFISTCSSLATCGLIVLSFSIPLLFLIFVYNQLYVNNDKERVSVHKYGESMYIRILETKVRRLLDKNRALYSKIHALKQALRESSTDDQSEHILPDIPTFEENIVDRVPWPLVREKSSTSVQSCFLGNRCMPRSSFSRDCRFTATPSLCLDASSLECKAQEAAYRHVCSMGVTNLVAHESRLRGGSVRPDLVFIWDDILIVVEAKGKSPSATDRQAKATGIAVHEHTKDRVIALSYVLSIKRLAFIYDSDKQGVCVRKLAEDSQFADFMSANCEGKTSHFSTSSYAVGFSEPIATEVHSNLFSFDDGYVPQSGEFLLEDDGYFSNSESILPRFSAAGKFVGAATLGLGAAAYALQERYGVDDVSKLHSTEINEVVRPDSVVDCNYNVTVRADGVAVASNPSSELNISEKDFKKVSNTVFRTRKHLVQMSREDEVEAINLKYLDQEMFNSISPFFTPALRSRDVEFEVPRRLKLFKLLDEAIQKEAVYSVFCYIEDRRQVNYRHLYQKMTGIRKPNVYGSSDYIIDTAILDECADFETPMRKSKPEKYATFRSGYTSKSRSRKES
eukprot:NODE_131_length_2275_cov_411.741240_g106_i0.p1 GENE.NODE_131_length_2275_cov_411.741240_g106_i0~~NODE_131_length_2275_cov_411.741240_g106_i0.p1  ORF type:complete len:587 (-),score=-23.87 NODE_131_length_2275_cov_411.741240_g106_i0:485-2245(-)